MELAWRACLNAPPFPDVPEPIPNDVATEAVWELTSNARKTLVQRMCAPMENALSPPIFVSRSTDVLFSLPLKYSFSSMTNSSVLREDVSLTRVNVDVAMAKSDASMEVVWILKKKNVPCLPSNASLSPFPFPSLRWRKKSMEGMSLLPAAIR